MALPSQSERISEMSRPIMTRTGREARLGRFAIGVLAISVAAGAVYGLYRMIPASTNSPQTAAAKQPDAPKEAPKPKPEPKSLLANTTPPPATQPPEVVLNQGRGGGAVTNTLAKNEPLQQGTPVQATPTIAANPPKTDSTRPAPVDVTRADLKPQPPAPSQPAAGTPGQPLAPAASLSSIRAIIEEGDRALASGNLVQARVLMSRALVSSDASPGDQEVLRQKLTTINDDLVFSPKIAPTDGLVEGYTVQDGDSLSRIARRRELAIDWRFIQRVNRMSSPNVLHEGQKLKLVRGPFHAVVHKADFRLDVFAGSPDEPEQWLYIRSFRVGLGEGNSTPIGSFIVKKGSKLVDPPWVNPRTGEKFSASDPKNPIGEFWLGWEGVGDSAVYKGFGLHGTIDPDSIGQQKSMGCVRMHPDDIALVYEMLVEQVSVIKVMQ